MSRIPLPSLASAALWFAATCASADTQRVLPVLSQDSGQIEALLLLDASASSNTNSAVRTGALDRVLAITPSTNGGLRIKVAGDNKLSASLSLDAQPGLALLCRGDIGLAAALGSLGEQCLLADLGSRDPLLNSALDKRIAINGSWKSANSAFDLEFGLSWLDSRFAADFNPLASSLLINHPPSLTASLAELGPSLALSTSLDVITRGLSITGTRAFGDQAWLQLDGSRSRSVANGLALTAPFRVDTTSLGLAAGYGDFSGRISGRLIELPRAGGNIEAQSTFDVDLGVSWRTPWQARLTVGASNLLGKPDVSQWPMSALPRGADKEADTRTPYVRYHQDL
ncbi:MAG: hypothetical protein ACT4NL_14835 [Pseudomarimonas sp.]